MGSRTASASKMKVSKDVKKSHRLRMRPNERYVLLVVGDFIAGVIAIAIALVLWANRGEEYLDLSLTFLLTRPPTWFFLLPIIWPLLIAESYDYRHAGDLLRTIRTILLSTVIAFGLYTVLYFSSEPLGLPRFGVAVFIISVIPLTLIWRIIYTRVFLLATFVRKTIIVGGGKAGADLIKVINQVKPPPYKIVGVVDDDPKKHEIKIEGHTVLGGAEVIPEYLQKENVSDLVVAISGRMKGDLFQILLDAQEGGVEIVSMQTAYEDLLGRVPIFHLESDWIIRSFVDQSRVSTFFHIGKRVIDILGGLVGSIIMLLVLPFVAIATVLESGRPVFYTQTRSGRGDRPYSLIKFRTMIQDAEKDGQPQWAQENDERTTRVGRILRKTHLDEFPQFINVLRGDMSLVGPRPERPELVTHFEQHVPFYRSRLLVKPGITGWAQINQSYASNVEETNEKLEYDLYYIKRRNLIMDLVILLRTPANMLGLRGR